MAKTYLDGRPTNLKAWSKYGQLGTEAEEPIRKNVNPDGVRHLDGSTNKATWSKGDPKQDRWPSLGRGAGSGEARVSLAKTQARKRGA
jgi:hypothetical protein